MARIRLQQRRQSRRLYDLFPKRRSHIRRGNENQSRGHYTARWKINFECTYYFSTNLSPRIYESLSVVCVCAHKCGGRENSCVLMCIVHSIPSGCVCKTTPILYTENREVKRMKLLKYASIIVIKMVTHQSLRAYMFVCICAPLSLFYVRCNHPLCVFNEYSELSKWTINSMEMDFRYSKYNNMAGIVMGS